MPLDQLGLVKTTLLDFPGQVAAMVFTPGCNLRCPWCHNPGLVHPPWDAGLWAPSQILSFLRQRAAVLQGVVVTGGEPLIHRELPEFLTAIKALGLQIKLDTNGTFPECLAALPSGLLDYVALDLKAPPAGWAAVTGVAPGAEASHQTIRWLQASGLKHELRLTWLPGLHQLSDLPAWASLMGTSPVWIQGFRPGRVLDPSRAPARAPTAAELGAVVDQLRALGVAAKLR